MSMAGTHTPGPWRVDTDIGTGHVDIHGPDGRTIARVLDTGHGETERNANARLICAAPDLYEALEIALDGALRSNCDPDERITSAIRAALAQAA